MKEKQTEGENFQTDSLVNGILESAEKENNALLNAAEEYSAERIALANSRAEKILKDAEETVRIQSAAIEREIESRIKMEKKKRKLEIQEQYLEKLLQLVGSKLEARIQKSEYIDTICGLIAEAGIGLAVNEASIIAGDLEWQMIDKALIEKSRKLLVKMGMKEIDLQKAEKPQPGLRGIRLLSKDGSMSFDNSLSGRQERLEPLIRRLVHQTAFSEDKAGSHE